MYRNRVKPAKIARELHIDAAMVYIYINRIRRLYEKLYNDDAVWAQVRKDIYERASRRR